MTLAELGEKIRKILPVAVPVVILGILIAAIYFIFFRRPHPEQPLPEPLARSTASANSFAWSQDGSKIYYFCAERGESPLRVLKMEAGSILEDNVVAVEISTVTDVFWSSADSALILGQLESTGDPVVNIVDFTSGDITPAALGEPAQVYSWSFDGTKIAYITSPDRNDKSNINLFSVSDLRLYEESVLEEPLESIEQIFWASDEKKLFITARPSLPGEAPVMPELHLLDLEKKELELLVAKDKGYFDFAPHASAGVLLLSAGGIDLMDAETKEIVTVFETFLHPYGTKCVWFDGEQLLCKLVSSSATSGSNTLWELDLVTAQKQRIASEVGSFFATSPQGDQLAYIDEDGFIKVIPIE